MDQIIIYPLESLIDGPIAVVHPTSDSGFNIQEVARKDVPQGVPYLIISLDQLPEDRTFRGAWTADFSVPDGYGDPDGYWAEQEAGDDQN